MRYVLLDIKKIIKGHLLYVIFLEICDINPQNSLVWTFIKILSAVLSQKNHIKISEFDAFLQNFSIALRNLPF